MFGDVSFRSRVAKGGGWLLVAMIVCGAFEPLYLKIFFVDRGPLREQLTIYPDIAFPAYPPFLRQIRSSTEAGATIALAVPAREWQQYQHAYLRASYILAGRRVIPLLAPDNSVHLERLREATYVIAWHVNFASPEFVPVWKSREGSLEKRVR